jgi:hypothetical protein
MVRGQQRHGFEILRDVVTTHRRAWAAANLETTLRRSWELPLRELSTKVNRAIAARGKMPSARQLTTLAERRTKIEDPVGACVLSPRCGAVCFLEHKHGRSPLCGAAEPTSGRFGAITARFQLNR